MFQILHSSNNIEGIDYIDNNELITRLKMAVRSEVGPLATPERVVIVPGLPKVSNYSYFILSIGY